MDNQLYSILVVEDSPTQATIIRRVLESNHFKVSVAADGKQALHLLDQHPFHLVISDIVMPEMDGFQLCSAIKQSDNLKGIPVILLTALVDPDDIIMGLQAGADNFITKPYNEHDLLSRIQFLLINRELNPIRGGDMEIRFLFNGKSVTIDSERKQILDLLISVFEEAVRKNHELTELHQQLQSVNHHLEEQVQIRTRELQTRLDQLRQMDMELRKSEHSLLKAQHVAHLGIGEWNVNDHGWHWSEEIVEILGIPSDHRKGDLKEVITQSVYPDDRSKLDEITGITLHSQPIRPFEFRIVRPDGAIHTLWIESGETILDEQGNPLIMTIIVQDITDRRQMDELLQQQHEQFQKLIEYAPVAICIVREDGTIAYANPAAIKFWGGGSEHDLINTRFLDRVALPFRLMVTEQLNHLIDRQLSIPTDDHEYLKIDGTLFNVEVNAVPIQWEARRASLIFWGDITERKKNQQQLIHHLDELQRFQQVAIDRELRMIELKKEINALLKQAGQNEKYRIHESDLAMD